MSQFPPLRVLQVSDLHLFAERDQQLLGVPTARSCATLLEQLQQLDPKPDLVLLTGDLSQDGTAASYHRVLRLFEPLQTPVYWLPGNHDCVEVMERSLVHPLFCADKAFEVGGWKLILLNSQQPGCVSGALSPESLAWLEQELDSAPNTPTLVSMHHPPFGVNSHWLDGSSLQNAEAFFSVIDWQPQVQLVVFGHIHQEFQRQRNTVSYLGSPSTCIQFAPYSSEFALGHEEPGFRLLNLYPNGQWTTAVQRVEYAYELDLAATGY